MAMGNMSPDQLNQLMRSRLLATGIRQEKNLGTSSGQAAGSTTRIKLQNIGLTTRLRLLITANYTVGTATATVSPLGMLNAITRIKLQDYDGTDRLNASPVGIWSRNCLRERRIDGLHRDSLNAIGGLALIGSAALTSPSIGTAVGAATAFYALDVPIAYDYDGGDLRGLMGTQSTVGEVWLSIDWASALYGNGDDTKVFNGAATTTVTGITFDVTVIQEFLLPQFDGAIGAVPLPELDLLTVNELITYTTSDNLASGQEKLISFPNVRSIHGVHYQYFHNSLLGGSSTTNDLTRHAIVVGGNTRLKDRLSRNEQLWSQRQDIGADLGKGMYFFDFAGLAGAGFQPVQTALLGNMQLGVTPATSPSGTTFVQSTLESQYIKGTPLGAVSQQ